MNELPSLEYSCGVYFERERIIKLLEEMPDNMFGGGSEKEEVARAAIRLAIHRIHGTMGEMRKIK
jgi:hypothetical protein